MHRLLGAVVAAGVLSQAPFPALAAQPDPRTVQAIMDTLVDPSADALWDTAGTVVGPQGETVRRPRGPKDWAKARALALKVAEGARLLQSPRPVGGDGHWKLADAATPGIRDAAQIQADIGRDPKRFYAAAARLERTALDAADALRRKDIGAFLDAGARIDAACEACHAAYWYPRAAPRPLPGPDAFAKIAGRP